jgi:hypothetical protein
MKTQNLITMALKPEAKTTAIVCCQMFCCPNHNRLAVTLFYKAFHCKPCKPKQPAEGLICCSSVTCSRPIGRTVFVCVCMYVRVYAYVCAFVCAFVCV